MFDWLFSEPLAVGTPAPDFSLPDQSGKVVSLASLKGRNVVLVFYPGDDTTVCRKQLCEFRDRWSDAREGSERSLKRAWYWRLEFSERWTSRLQRRFLERPITVSCCSRPSA